MVEGFVYMKGNWTADRIDKLRQMSRKGHTSYEIARELGVSRAAICGRAWRLGIRLRGSRFGVINRGGVYRWGSFNFKRAA